MELVTAFRFKELNIERGKRPAVRRAAAPLVGVRKQSVETVEKVDDRTLRFTISTGLVDRDLDKIDPAGWQLDHFRKNPVVLWAHQATLLPVGKALEVSRLGDRLRSVVSFLPAENYGAAGDFANQVYRLARDGYLAATSVGFRPLRWDFTADKDRGGDDWFPGIDYHEQELVEFSLCTVPSNPEALIEPVLPDDAVGGEAPSLPESLAAAFAARAKRRRVLQLLEATR
jgi:HK97 family phage prohead protease